MMTPITEGTDYNLRHAHERDADLSFDPVAHVYMHSSSVQPLTSVTSFISSFFDEYDPYFWLRKDKRITPEELQCRMSEQDRKGYVARNLGTFMHTQIENYFLGDEVEKVMCLETDDGRENRYSIEKELDYFSDFVNHHHPKPYRTEWQIYDEVLWIAGTLDLLVEEEEGTFTIYDWKRSRRMGREYGTAFYPNESNFRQSGKGVLSHLPDTPFIHASLQQNLYRYILKAKYDIIVDKMYLVVLSPTFSRFHKIPVRNMDYEIDLMLKTVM